MLMVMLFLISHLFTLISIGYLLSYLASVENFNSMSFEFTILGRCVGIKL